MSTRRELPKLADKADIASRLRRYIPDVLAAGVTIQDFSYNSSEYEALNGKCFQGNGIAVDTIYIRREGMSLAANHEELHMVINSRSKTGASTSAKFELEHELDQQNATV